MEELAKWARELASSVNPAVRWSFLATALTASTCVGGCYLWIRSEGRVHEEIENWLRREVTHLTAERDAHALKVLDLATARLELKHANTSLEHCRREITAKATALHSARRAADAHERALRDASPADAERRQKACGDTYRSDHESTLASWDHGPETQARHGCYAKLMHKARLARNSDLSVEVEYKTSAGHSAVCSCSLQVRGS